MIDGLLALAVIAGLAGASVGWGRLVRRLAGAPRGSHAVSAAFGLAALVFLGGVACLGGLARPLALEALVLAGLALLALHVAPSDAASPPAGPRSPLGRRDLPLRGLRVAIAAAVMIFAAATQLAPRQFNPGDDLQKYLAHAVRLVRTGTLDGSPFNALGVETLGAQALLQGFFVGHLPLPYINALDAVFCLGLCLALVGGVATRRPAHGVAAILGTLAVVLIDPQSVNVSSLYSSAALIAALVILGVDPGERAPAGTAGWRRALAPGLVCAALVALKPTNLPFLALWLGLSTPLAAAAGRAWRPALRDAAWTLAWTVVFLAPWLLLFAPFYVAGLLRPLPPPAIPIPSVPLVPELWSPEASFYGAAPLAYTLVAIGLGVLAAALFISGRREDAADRAGAMALAGACGAAAIWYFAANTAGLLTVEAVGALRYSIPTLIGVFPAALALAPLRVDRPDAPRPRGAWLAALCAVVALAPFVEPAMRRWRLALDHGTTLAYLPSWPDAAREAARDYWEEILDGRTAAWLARYQAVIPPGTPVVAWVEAPILLDWARNPIIDVNESGLAPAWASFPRGGYVIWQYRGRYVRRPQAYLSGIAEYGRRPAFVWARAFEFHRRLTELVPRARVVAHDDADGVIVLRLPDPE